MRQGAFLDGAGGGQLAIDSLVRLGDMGRPPVYADDAAIGADALGKLENALAAPAPDINDGHTLKIGRQGHMAKAGIAKFPMGVAIVFRSGTTGCVPVVPLMFDILVHHA